MMYPEFDMKDHVVELYHLVCTPNSGFCYAQWISANCPQNKQYFSNKSNTARADSVLMSQRDDITASVDNFPSQSLGHGQSITMEFDGNKA